MAYISDSDEQFHASNNSNDDKIKDQLIILTTVMIRII